MSIDFDWLESRIFNRSLSDGERAALSSIVSVQSFARGENIVSQGQPGGVLKILRSGKAEVAADNDGKHIHIADTAEGALFGEMTVLTGENTSASVIARDDCVVYKLTRDGLSGIMDGNSDLIFSLFAYMLLYSSKVIRHMNEEHIAMLHYITGSRL